jgi:hypothetical protein
MTHPCGYGSRCVFEGRVEKKGQLCPECLAQEIQESHEEIEPVTNDS